MAMARQGHENTTAEPLSGLFSKKESVSKAYVDEELEHVYKYADDSHADLLRRMIVLDDSQVAAIKGLQEDRTRHNQQLHEMDKEMHILVPGFAFMKKYLVERVKFLEAYIEKDPHYKERSQEIEDELEEREYGPKPWAKANQHHVHIKPSDATSHKHHAHERPSDTAPAA